MKNRSSLITATLAFALLPLAAQADKFDDRAADAAAALNQMTHMPDRLIPEYLLARATCVAVIPREQEGAFFFGGSYGRGLVSCRTGDNWSLPSYMWVAGGSYGAQWGYKRTDEILLFYGKDNAVRQASSTRLDLGGDASIGAGIIGRQVDADLNILTLSTAVLSYSRARGFYAGVSLTGTFYMIDRKANQHAFGGAFGGAPQLLKTDSTQSTVASSNGVQAFEDALYQLPRPERRPAPAPAPEAATPKAAPGSATAGVPTLQNGEQPQD